MHLKVMASVAAVLTLLLGVLLGSPAHAAAVPASGVPSLGSEAIPRPWVSVSPVGFSTCGLRGDGSAYC